MQTKPDTQPSPEAPVDRRRHPRYRFSIPLTIRSADGEIMRAITIEISASGVSAITERSLRLNDRVELEPIAASKVLAVVRHNVGKVYGFEFFELSSEHPCNCRTLQIASALPSQILGHLGRSFDSKNWRFSAVCVLRERHRTIKHRSDSLVPTAAKILKLATSGAVYRSRNC